MNVTGAGKTSKLKTETDNDEIMEEGVTTSGDFVKLFQWTKSVISSQYSGLIPREQELQGEVLELEEGLQDLRDTQPKMYVLLDRAEWSSHEDYVVELLPYLKDAVYDAEDLLDEFKWYELKVTVEGNANQCPFSDFFNNVITGSFNENLQVIQDRMDGLLGYPEKMGLHEVRQRFNKSVRLETTCLLTETNIFGRDKEMKQVIRLLSKPKQSRGAQSENKGSDESKIPGLHVLPIVGIRGVGKTCLAQHVCNHSDIRSHFNLIIWICVSGDFDVMRLTKQALESCSGERPTSEDLNILQHALSEHVRDKKLLIILDDLWDDAFKEYNKYWNIFCAPLKHIERKSLMLVTTRSTMVAHKICTMKPFELDGLKGNAFRNFFKQCIFGSESSNNDPNLERIGRSILPRLKGSPLAAKSVGLLLRTDLSASHWKYVLESELWELGQRKTDILPSLQLSYMHLPLHLK
ncbi:putative disease resistance protein RGA4, partial [Aegilops tauschii subsp. strangulata]|uniref:putative disease resistance protein RGA4 n=1 Tax=Aegilops tauschii subsp. strangulata TaxID=200361 RepID=UPI003CC8ABF9